MKKRVVLLGRGTLAIECLNALKNVGSQPVAVICDPKDDGKDTWIQSLFGACLKAGYIEGETVFRTGRVNEPPFINVLKKNFADIEYIFSVQTRSILHEGFIRLAGRYVYNLHLAPLPKLRGVHTSSWAVLDGLKTMGVTIHLIQDQRIDAGPVVAQKLFRITGNDTARTIYDKCVMHGTALLRNQMKRLITPSVTLTPQDDSQATYHSLKELNYSDTRVPGGRSVDETLRFIRSRIFPPLQLPHTVVDGTTIGIIAAAGRKTKTIPPAAVYRGKTVIIPCTDGVISVLKYKITQ